MQTVQSMSPAARKVLLGRAIVAMTKIDAGFGRLDHGGAFGYFGNGAPSNTADKNAERYGPCPCGSGKKRKFCNH